MLRILIGSVLLGLLATQSATAAGRDIFVAGGTGALGADIVQLLLDQGERVTVFTRPGSDRSRLDGLEVEFIEGDLTNPEEVAAAFAGRQYHAVFTAVRVQTGDIHFYATIMPPLTEGAKKSGAAQFIHASAVGAGSNADNFKNLGWERVPGLLDRMADQGVGEDVLKGSGVPYTIVRNARIQPEGTPATGKASLTEDQTVLEPMTRPDLALLMVSCLDNPECLDKTFHVRDGAGLPWPPPNLE